MLIKYSNGGCGVLAVVAYSISLKIKILVFIGWQINFQEGHNPDYLTPFNQIYRLQLFS